VTETPVQFGRVAMNPSPNGDMVRRHAAFLQELFDIAIRKRKAQVPTHGNENRVRLKLPPFELHRPWFGHLTTLPALDTPRLQHCPRSPFRLRADREVQRLEASIVERITAYSESGRFRQRECRTYQGGPLRRDDSSTNSTGCPEPLIPDADLATHKLNYHLLHPSPRLL
jgi:hypothetical protein